MIRNEIGLLHEMLTDMKQAPPIYQPGNYWLFYVDKITKQLERGDLNQFRNQVMGPGTMASFGGGRDLEGVKYGWHLYPFHGVFTPFDVSRVVRGYNRLVDRLFQVHPALGYLSFRAALAREYFQETIEARQDAAWMVARAHDSKKSLEKLEDSHEGNPVGFHRQERFYTVRFLDEAMQLFFLQDFINVDKLQSVLELGSGIGLKASLFLKMNKDLTYILVDIPPALYVAQQYLSAVVGGVLPYHQAKEKLKTGLDLSDYRVVCLAPWMLDVLKEFHCDLCINVASFQEMEPWLVENYLMIFKRFRPQWVYLSELKEGHVTGREGEHGVLKQTKYQDYLRFLSPEYHLVKEENLKSTLSFSDKSCDMLFSK